jgi:hypothetical protein
MIYAVLTVICLMVAAVGKAAMDTLRFHFDRSIFSRWENQYFVDPAISWRNKYKNHDPAQGERFPGSTTIFVFTTDLWHLSQFVFLRLFFAAVITYHLSGGITSLFIDLGPYGLAIDYLGLSIVFGATFQIMYGKIFIK